MNRQPREPTSGGPFQSPSHSRGYPPEIQSRRPPTRGGRRPHRLPLPGHPPPFPHHPPPPFFGHPGQPPLPYSAPPPPPIQRRAGYETMATEKAAMDVLATSLGLKIVDDELNSSSDSDDSTTAKDVKDIDEQEQKKKLEDAPAGSITEIKSLYQGPVDYQGRAQWIDRYPDDVEEAAENEETAKYALVVRKKKCFDGRRKFDLDSILINSPQLKEILGKVFDGYPGVTCVLKRLVFEAPFAPFVHRWQEFTEAMKKERDPVAKEHLDLLHGLLREELHDTIKAVEDYLVHGVMMFEHLWALFQPGAAVYTMRSGSAAALTFVSGQYAKTDSGDAFQMCLESIGSSGNTCGRLMENVDLYAFTGTRPISQLTSCPLSFHPDKEMIRTNLVERGRKYASLTGYHYKAYDGIALSWDSRGKQIPLTVSGRIIIDSEAFDRFNPDRMDIFANLKDEDFTRSDVPEISAQISGGRDSKNDYDVIQISPGMNLTEEAHLICKATVNGYSIKLKKWLSFFVDCIEDIEWNDTAFETLVLPTDTKELLMSFVESQISHKDDFDDIIEGKGKGIIMLLSGPPGVGKTLTAESVAEAMHIPLYMMSAGDLGIRPNEVENNLQDILEMVAKWNAILLLDECDVFLEERTTQELERNKLVSIFLRTLEYYEGILFLTTNRVGHMDTAFQSRIHVSLAYPDLDTISRRKIWWNFLRLKGENSEISERDLDILAEVKLNGRQIKNVIKTAYLLSLRKKTPLRLESISTVLAIEGRRPDC